MQRHREPEWMDSPTIEPRRLRTSLRFIRFINTALGYKRVVVHHLQRFSRRWRPGQQIDIIDLATGSADIPRAILKWADRCGFDMRIVGIDRHPITASTAAESSSNSRLRIVQADVFDLPFGRASFDYAITSMFLHHLDDGDIVRVFQAMDRLARRGIIASDLLRHRRAYLWIKLLTLPCPAMLRHDAIVSIAQSLTREEVLRLRDEAVLHYAEYFRHFGHRWCLAGEKPTRQ